jgi:multimeric flavodoxin WrbA
VKKIIGFLGSPHVDGNTGIMVREVLRGAASRGASTKLVVLNELNAKGCQGCMGCQANGGHCVVKDDIAPLLEEIYAADGVVLGTPVYMWQMTAQLKTLVDRFFCYLKPDYSSHLGAGKRTVLVVAQNNANPDSFKVYLESTRDMLGFLGFPVENMVHAWGVGAPGDVKSQAEPLRAAFEAGSALAR